VKVLESDNDYCRECGELLEHCDCEPQILTALEEYTCHACGKAIHWGELMQTWEEGRAHLVCPTVKE
jgi:uncharacterized protein with PIN domain